TMVTYQTGTPNGDLDIVGLRLGMSPSQVEAILKSRNGDYKILYSRAKLHGAFRLPKDGERAKNAIPGSDYVKNIFASDEGYRLRKKGTQIALYFARPPSKNKLIYVKKTTIFQDEGPTVEAYDKAFMKKYGDEFYSTKAAQKLRNAQKKPGQISFPKRETHHDTKVIRLNSGQKSTNNENLACYRNIGYAIKALETTGNHIDKYKNCGLILTSMHAAQRDIAAVFSYEMSLIDFDELNKSHAKMILFIKENNKKVKQEKLEAASKKDIDLF
ncbi:MAG: hypothetical protein JKY45_12325, partial [Emcibacter sp.]|nr:hypothetical protein [Emcibacter sp.]